jgi:formylglycine-generating enzyme required for sulfatase activity
MKKIFNTFRVMLCAALLLVALALNKAHAEITDQGKVYLGTMLFREVAIDIMSPFPAETSYGDMVKTFKKNYNHYLVETKKNSTGIMEMLRTAVKNLQSESQTFNKKDNKDNVASYNLVIFTDGEETVDSNRQNEAELVNQIDTILSTTTINGKPITSYSVSITVQDRVKNNVLFALAGNSINNRYHLDKQLELPDNLLNGFLDIVKPAFNGEKLVVIYFIFDCSGSINSTCDPRKTMEQIVAFFKKELPLRMAGMQLTPGGSFVMGSNPDEAGREDDETSHQEQIEAFYVCDHEVTQGEYRSQMFRERLTGADWENFPMTQVDWFDAITYCNRRSVAEGFTPVYNLNSENPDEWDRMVTWDKTANGYRLPTEAEWEWAARAKTTTPFYTGLDINTDAATFNQNTDAATFPVKRHNPNQFGYYDMAGSVSEWTFSRYKAYPYDDSTSADLKRWPYRIFRDGNFATPEKDKANLRSAARDYTRFDQKSAYVGFRVVRNGGEQK